MERESTVHCHRQDGIHTQSTCFVLTFVFPVKNGRVYILHFIVFLSAHTLHRFVGLRGIEQAFAGYRIYPHGISKQGALEFWDRATREGNPRIDGLARLGTYHLHLFFFNTGLDYASDPRYENGYGSERIESFMHYWTIHRVVDCRSG